MPAELYFNCIRSRGFLAGVHIPPPPAGRPWFMTATDPKDNTGPDAGTAYPDFSDTTPATRDAADAAESGDVLTVFETLESAFWWVAVGPFPLTIHPRHIADLPDRALTLYQLRVRLASPTVSRASRAVIWSYLARHARTPGPQQADWTIATAGMALPALVRIVATLTRNPRNQPDTGRGGCDLADLEAAALGGFYHELRRTDTDPRDPRLLSRLLTAAERAARTLRDTGRRAPTTSGSDREAPTTPATGRMLKRRYPNHAARQLQRARAQARNTRQARQQSGPTRGGQVRP